MSTKIRMARVGTKNKARWRIVVCDEGKKRNGRVVEILGYYDPLLKPPKLEVDREKINLWQTKGARLTPALEKILK